MCVLNVACINTTPGADPANPFCPPAGFEGGTQDYVDMCRFRYANDLAAAQRMLSISRYGSRARDTVHCQQQIIGPYSREAYNILLALK